MKDIPIVLSIRLGGPEPNNPVTIFHQAVGFYLAGHRALLSIPTGPRSVQSLDAAAVVNMVFAVEVFLKAIINNAGLKKKTIHKIRELANYAPDEIMAKVKIEYDQVCSQPDFSQILDITNDMFVQVRYQYEYDVNVLYESAVFALGSALYKVCDEIFTGPVR